MIGIGLAVLAGRWLQPHLFQTSPRDGAVLAAVTAITVLTALIAGWVPARRTVRLNPTDALRHE